MATARLDVGILGATGMVGQQLVRRLDGHPWFRVTWLGGSERSAGRTYGDVPWLLASPMPGAVRPLTIDTATPSRAPGLVCPALDAPAAATLEPAFAAAAAAIGRVWARGVPVDVVLIGFFEDGLALCVGVEPEEGPHKDAAAGLVAGQRGAL